MPASFSYCFPFRRVPVPRAAVPPIWPSLTFACKLYLLMRVRFCADWLLGMFCFETLARVEGLRPLVAVMFTSAGGPLLLG